MHSYCAKELLQMSVYFKICDHKKFSSKIECYKQFLFYPKTAEELSLKFNMETFLTKNRSHFAMAIKIVQPDKNGKQLEAFLATNSIQSLLA
ncbi:conserved hypothetical protein [Trichinella spiralis]|uniref:hypothetical protein n=1 Tax=Trichinella spiralis TaxID=6334 RepID=UPI0001EFB835|nr:conserved hypothetical protein [Trichinella spiralis]